MSGDIRPECPKTEGGAKHTGVFDERRFGKYFLLLAFVAALVAFINVIKVFIIEIIIAAVFSTLFFPVFKLLLRWFNNRRGLAAFVTCVLVLVGILIPLIVISDIVIRQSVDLYQTAGPRLNEILQKGDEGILGQIKNSPLGKWMAISNIDWQSAANDLTMNLGSTLAKVINKTSRVTIMVIVNLFIVLFSIFYFLRDGQSMLKRARNFIPLDEDYKDLIIKEFTSISHATVKGTLMIALIQSFLGTLTLLVFGVKAWMLWGVVMLVLAIIPFVGTGAVLVPTGIIMVIGGEVWQGITIIILSVGVISLVDNFLRPRIVGSRAGMHDLLVFFSTLGGIVAFGPVGFIVGPLITAIFLTILDIYLIEFQGQIAYSKRSKMPKTDENAPQ